MRIGDPTASLQPVKPRVVVGAVPIVAGTLGQPEQVAAPDWLGELSARLRGGLHAAELNARAVFVTRVRVHHDEGLDGDSEGVEKDKRIPDHGADLGRTGPQTYGPSVCRGE